MKVNVIPSGTKMHDKASGIYMSNQIKFEWSLLLFFLVFITVFNIHTQANISFLCHEVTEDMSSALNYGQAKLDSQ